MTETKTDSYAEVYPYNVQWLWRNRIPLSEITIVSAFGGTGKGMLMADLAGRISTGRAMPGEMVTAPPQHVIMASTEDDKNSVTVNRLIAANADLPRVHDITEKLMDAGGLPNGIPVIAAKLADLGGEAAFVVLDPLSAICPLGVFTVPRVRAAFTPLQRLANETGTAIACTHHVNKDGRVNGSQAVVDAVRSVLKIERDPVNPDVRIVKVHKSNAGAFPTDVAFVITGEGSGARVQWVNDSSEDDAGSIATLLDALPEDDTPECARVLARRTSLRYPIARALLARMVTERQVYEPFDGWYARLGRTGVR